MAGVAIGLGIFVFFVTQSFLTNIAHGQHIGGFVSIALGIWAAWPLMHQNRIQRYNLMHPVPREYKAPLKHVFAKIREILAERTYNFGDRWHVVTADTQAGRIVASLRFSDEHTSTSLDSSGHMRTRTERQQRSIDLVISMRSTTTDRTLVQLDFVPKAEGFQFNACDSIITSLCHEIEAAIGACKKMGSTLSEKLPAPPWWLLGASGLALLMLLEDIQKVVLR